MTTQELMDRILAMSPEDKRVTPFPSDWELPHWQMLKLIDRGWLGMDGFRYCFVEYARDCWERCGLRISTD